MKRQLSRAVRRCACAAGLVLLVAAAASADQVVITLDANPGTACNTPWHEASCELVFLPTTTQDCIVAGQLGYCYPSWLSIGLGTGIGVTPARMRVDFSAIQGVRSVQLQIYEAHELGCTRAFLYSGSTLVDSAGSQYTGSNHWIQLDAGSHDVDHLFVSGHEGYCWEIRLIGDTLVDTAGSTWGALKALY